MLSPRAHLTQAAKGQALERKASRRLKAAMRAHVSRWRYTQTLRSGTGTDKRTASAHLSRWRYTHTLAVGDTAMRAHVSRWRYTQTLRSGLALGVCRFGLRFSSRFSLGSTDPIATRTKPALRLRVWGMGFKVWGLGFVVWFSSRYVVWGSGLV